MAKTSKLLTLDVQLVEKLKKEKNASALVNNLLKDHYNETDHLLLEELQKKKELSIIEKKQVEKKIKELEKQIKEEEKRNKEISNLFKDLPEEIISDMKFFKNMDKKTLYIRHKEIYYPKYKIPYPKLEKAFIKFREGKTNGNNM